MERDTVLYCGLPLVCREQWVQEHTTNMRRHGCQVREIQCRRNSDEKKSCSSGKHRLWCNKSRIWLMAGLRRRSTIQQLHFRLICTLKISRRKHTSMCMRRGSSESCSMLCWRFSNSAPTCMPPLIFLLPSTQSWWRPETSVTMSVPLMSCDDIQSHFSVQRYTSENMTWAVYTHSILNSLWHLVNNTFWHHDHTSCCKKTFQLRLCTLDPNKLWLKTQIVEEQAMYI